MKKIIYFTVLFAILSCNNNSPASEISPEDKTTTITEPAATSAEPVRELQSVEDIKGEYSYITGKVGSGSMDSVSFKYNCNNEKNGKVVYFTENGKVRRITHTYNEYSHFSATDDYFVKDGAVFFVHKRQVVWSFVDQDQTKDDITEKRFYVINSKLTECTENKSTVISSSGKVGKPTNISTKKTECPSFEPLSKEFDKLYNLSTQRKDLKCL
ncbi:MAG TPA: hypothetical protein VF581_06995 [Flavobacterium sp.]|jgi:hypothetical protein